MLTFNPDRAIFAVTGKDCKGLLLHAMKCLERFTVNINVTGFVLRSFVPTPAQDNDVDFTPLPLLRKRQKHAFDLWLAVPRAA